ncbi:MAG: hypothetical protein JXA68_10610 [Ignavibacteriales bacterium]|nr:hypothetical protein [Ignavibacteriales bacterium]
MNDNNWLNFQSFQRNQNIIESINNYLIHLSFNIKGIDDKFDKKDLLNYKEQIVSFLNTLEKLIDAAGTKDNPQTISGIDDRFQSLVQNFNQAKGKKTKFKSLLFRQRPTDVLPLFESSSQEDIKKLVKSLTELETLLEDHASEDINEILGEF